MSCSPPLLSESEFCSEVGVTEQRENRLEFHIYGIITKFNPVIKPGVKHNYTTYLMYLGVQKGYNLLGEQ